MATLSPTRYSSVSFWPASARGYTPKTPRLRSPSNPSRPLLEAIRSHQAVGLGTGAHNNEQGHAFLLSLVRDPRFPSAGADLVVECGSARYQDVMDRFVAGEDVSHETLRRAWEDTTQPHAGCETPIHEELYRAVRTINAALPKAQRVRIFLGDPPIDWNSPTEKQDREKFMFMRDSYPAELIQRDILSERAPSADRLWARAPPATADAQQLRYVAPGRTDHRQLAGEQRRERVHRMGQHTRRSRDASGEHRLVATAKPHTGSRECAWRR